VYCVCTPVQAQVLAEACCTSLHVLERRQGTQCVCPPVAHILLLLAICTSSLSGSPALSAQLLLCRSAIAAVFGCRLSRASPVFQARPGLLLCRNDIMGVVMVKELVLVDPDGCLAVSELNIRELPQLPADTPM